MSLASYRDYRFRAPNLLLLQENFEHSIWGPFGLKFMADQGKVALTRDDIGFSHMKHSFAGGLTLRAGGFPMVSLMFAWGGSEGHHNIANMNASTCTLAGKVVLSPHSVKSCTFGSFGFSAEVSSPFAVSENVRASRIAFQSVPSRVCKVSMDI